MKVGIITAWSERGAANVSLQFANVLREKHEVFIYARGESEKTQKSSSGYNVTYGKNFSYTILDKIDVNHLLDWISQNHIDILIFNEQHDWRPLLHLKKKGIKIGAYIDYYTTETKDLFQLYDFLICNTERHYSVFKNHPQSYLIPWGTNTELFKPKNNNTNKNSTVFFHSAGMNPYRKGTDILLKAFHKAIPEKSKLLIHSQVDITLFFPNLKSVITELENQGKLKIIKQTVEAPGLYYLGDVYVYPSRLEGIGLTVPEALSSGLPTITTNEAPMNEFVKENTNGSLINITGKNKRKDNYFWEEVEPSVEHLAELLEEYSQLKDLSQKKKATRAFAVEKLSMQQNFQQLNSIVEEVKLIPLTYEIENKVTQYIKKKSWLFELKHLSFVARLRNLYKSYKR